MKKYPLFQIYRRIGDEPISSWRLALGPLLPVLMLQAVLFMLVSLFPQPLSAQEQVVSRVLELKTQIRAASIRYTGPILPPLGANVDSNLVLDSANIAPRNVTRAPTRNKGFLLKSINAPNQKFVSADDLTLLFREKQERWLTLSDVSRMRDDLAQFLKKQNKSADINFYLESSTNDLRTKTLEFILTPKAS